MSSVPAHAMSALNIRAAMTSSKGRRIQTKVVYSEGLRLINSDVLRSESKIKGKVLCRKALWLLHRPAGFVPAFISRKEISESALDSAVSRIVFLERL
jgi:hypothetical protein